MAKNYNKGKVIGMNQTQQQPKQNININPSDLVDVLCEKCECQTFTQVFLLKIIAEKFFYLGKIAYISSIIWN